MEPIPPHQQLASAANIAWIGARVAQDAALSRCRAVALSRYRLAKEACVRLDWHDPLGRPREMACRKQLLALQRQGRIVLPPARRAPPVYRAELAAAPVWPAFTGLLGAFGTIALHPVAPGTPDSRDRWPGQAPLSGKMPAGPFSVRRWPREPAGLPFPRLPLERDVVIRQTKDSGTPLRMNPWCRPRA